MRGSKKAGSDAAAISVPGSPPRAREIMTDERSQLIQRGLWLNYASIGYMTVEALVALVAGAAAGSIALFGFGIDSVLELAASVAAQWRLRSDVEPARRARVESYTAKIIAVSFLALAAYIAFDSSR